MILLRPDCLVFKRADGENVPCSAAQVTVELLGEAAELLGDGFLHNAAEAVLHYFKTELGWTCVSVRQFSLALQKVLRGFGLKIRLSEQGKNGPRVLESDLRRIACESGKGFELFFFPRLRAELRRKLEESPQVLRFRGLRGCVKQLMGVRRWTHRCQGLNDQIVEYLRTCLRSESAGADCALVVL